MYHHRHNESNGVDTIPHIAVYGFGANDLECYDSHVGSMKMTVHKFNYA